MKATTKGFLASILFVIACVVIWKLVGDRITYEGQPHPLSELNELETKGVPQFVLPTLDGIDTSLEGFKGKVIVLNFWATWCAPCVTEFPSMVRMADKLKDKLVLVTVAADERKEDVVHFIDAFDGRRDNIVHLYDPSTKVAEMFGTRKLPETYVINREFKVVKKVVSSIEWDEEVAVEYLTRLTVQ